MFSTEAVLSHLECFPVSGPAAGPGHGRVGGGDDQLRQLPALHHLRDRAPARQQGALQTMLQIRGNIILQIFFSGRKLSPRSVLR